MKKVTEGGVDVRAMTEAEFEHYKDTGDCDERFCYEYDPAFVARIKEAAGATSTEYTVDGYRKLRRQRRSKPPRAPA